MLFYSNDAVLQLDQKPLHLPHYYFYLVLALTILGTLWFHVLLMLLYPCESWYWDFDSDIIESLDYFR